MTGGPELISLAAKEMRKYNFAVIIFRRRQRNNGVGNGLIRNSHPLGMVSVRHCQVPYSPRASTVFVDVLFV